MIRNFRGDLFFYCANGCDEDVAQYRCVQDIDHIHVFSINGKSHGAALYGISILETIIAAPEHLIKLSERLKRKNISPDRYLLGLCGLKRGVPAVCKETVKRILRRLHLQQ